MKKHSQSFKQNIKEMGRELDSLITYNLNGEMIELGNSELNSVTPVVESALLKSVMKELDIDSNVDIPLGTVINYKFGLAFNGSEYEHLDYGNYIVYSSEKQEDTNSYNIVCYDRMLASMVEYEKLQTTIKSFPMTVRDYIDCICADLGLHFKNKNEEFANYDKIIESDLYAELGYTYRDILDELAQVTASNIVINKNDEVEIKYIEELCDMAQITSNSNIVEFDSDLIGYHKITFQDELIDRIDMSYPTDYETIDEEYLKDVNVAFGEKYGPINSIVLSRAADSDRIYLRDEESIEANGVCEINISENQIMNFNNRDEFLPDILEQLNGLEFYTNDFSSTGVCYYEVGDMYRVKIDDNIYPCVLFNDQINITQGLEEIIYTDLPDQAETDYAKASKTDRKLNQTYLIVDKQNRRIEAVVSEVDEQNEKISRVEQTAEKIETTVEKLEEKIDEGGFVTTEVMNSAITQSANSIKEEVNGKFDDYSTTNEMNTAITQAVTKESANIKSEISGTYSTKSETTQAKNDAINSANSNTDDKLKNYSTTTQMNNIISQQITNAENSILLEVANNYVEDKEYTKAQIIAKINDRTSNVTINADSINLNGAVTANNYFKINTNGSMEATAGKIASWTIAEDSIHTSQVGISPSIYKWSFWAGETNGAIGSSNSDAKFKVLNNGYFEASRGKIGGWNIDDVSMYSDNSSATYDYRAYIQSTASGYDDDTWVFSTQRKTKSMSGYSGMAYITAGGRIVGENIRAENNLTVVNDLTAHYRILMGDSTGTYITSEGLSLDSSGSYYHAWGCVIKGQCIATEFIPSSLKENKKNFERFEDGLSIVDDIDFYKYNLIDEKNNHKKHIGFVIGDDFKYSHELTGVDKEEKEIGADVYSMASVSLQCIKQLKGIIKEQQEQINQLKERVNILENK